MMLVTQRAKYHNLYRTRFRKQKIYRLSEKKKSRILDEENLQTGHSPETTDLNVSSGSCNEEQVTRS